jgi:translation initiation factor IF-3
MLNELIRASQVQVIGADSEKLGVLSLEAALELARKEGVDLVEVAPNAIPPVCRIMDYMKLQYEKQRKMKEARKHQRHVELKEVKLRPNIDEHDYQTKLAHLREFILEGNKCKVSLTFKAGQLRRFEIGNKVVQKMLDDVKDICVIESRPSSQGRMISVIIAPTKEVIAEAERRFKLELQHKKEEHERRLLAKKPGKDPSEIRLGEASGAEPPAENEAGLAGNEPPHVENEAGLAGNEPPHVENEPPHVENEPPHVENEAAKPVQETEEQAQGTVDPAQETVTQP